MVIFSVLECVPVSSGAALDLGLATSVSWVSSCVDSCRRKNCTFLHLVRSSLSALRNTGFYSCQGSSPFKSGHSRSRDKNDVCFDVEVAKLHLLALGAETTVVSQEHSASRVPVRLLRLWCPLRLRPAVHRLWPVRRSIIRFLCRHALLPQCATTERCWSVRLFFTCQWTPNILPVTVLLSSMTEPSNFEYVPFSMPGRACQDDSFVSSVDNIKPRVDPFVFLVRHAVVVWASGRIQSTGAA